MDTLNPRREKFVIEYLIDLNATQAAIRAGYAVSGASTQGTRLLANDHVQREIAKGALIRAEQAEISVAWVLEGLKAVADRCMQAVPVFDRDGVPTGDYVFNAPGANKAYELIGKHLRMFSERLEVTDPEGKPLGTGALEMLMDRLEGIADRKMLAAPDDPTDG